MYLAAGKYMSEAPTTTTTTPLTHCIRVFSILTHKERGGRGGGRGLLTRDKVRGTIVHKAGRK
jgi:hypothetical protein